MSNKIISRIVLLLAISFSFLLGLNVSKQEKTSNLEFFESLNYDNGLDVINKIFERFPLQYGTTLGIDGDPQIRPIEFKFEEDGVLYFDTVIFYQSYKEMLEHPYIQICICDQETMTYLRLGGKVNFTDDKGKVEKCFEASEVLTSQFKDNKDLVIAYYLTDVWAEFNSFSPSLPHKTYRLTNQFDMAKE